MKCNRLMVRKRKKAKRLLTRRSVGESGVKPEFGPADVLLGFLLGEIKEARCREFVSLIDDCSDAGSVHHRHSEFRIGFLW